MLRKLLVHVIWTLIGKNSRPTGVWKLNKSGSGVL
jgi:hypothetical protein